MGFRLADLYVSITGQASGLNATLSGVENRLHQVGRSGAGMGKALGASLATSFAGAFAALSVGSALGALKDALVGGLQSSVEGAMNLDSVLEKTGVIFGDQAKVITGAADEMAAKFGVVKGEFVDAAASFGAVFKGMGKTRQEAAETGVSLAKLAMDMASFEGTGATTADAITAISAALRGEMDPIERFRVFLNADAIAAEALRMGLAKTKGEIDASAKKAATMSLIFKQTADAQGAVARNSGQMDDRLKAMQGRFANLAASIGQTLTPIFGAFLDAAGGAIGGVGTAFESNKSAITAWATGVGEDIQAIIAKAAEFGSALQSFFGSDAIGVIRSGIGAAFTWLNDSVVKPFITRWVEGVEMIIVALRNWDSIIELVSIDIGEKLTNVGELFTWLVGAAGKAGEWFGTNWREIFVSAFSSVQAMATTFVNQIVAKFQELAKLLSDPLHPDVDWSKFDPVKDLKEMAAAGMKEWKVPGPEIEAPKLSNFDAAREQVLDRIFKKEEAIAAAKQKAATAAAIVGKGQAAGEDHTPAKAQKSGPAQLTFDLAEFAKKLQEGVFGKDKDAKRTADGVSKLVDLQKQSNSLQDQILKKKPGPGFAV